MARPHENGLLLDESIGPTSTSSPGHYSDQDPVYTSSNNLEYATIPSPMQEASSLSVSYAVSPLGVASVEAKKKLWWRNAVVNLMFIGSWFFFAILLSMYNKWMFSDSHFNFPYPLFVTSLHMVVQFILAALVLHIWPKKFKPIRYPTLEEYGKKAIPTGTTTSLDIGLSNLSLKTVTLSFYTMVKSSSLIFVLLFAFLFRLERFSWRLVGVILLICSGVLLMVATETHFVLGGFLLVLSASVLGGLRWGLTQVLFQNKKIGFSNPASTIFLLSPIMAITLCVLSLVIESWSSLFASEYFSGLTRTIKTVSLLIAPGVLAFCMVLSEFYIIQRAGVVPMSIAGIAKEVTTITVSAWFFGDELTPLNLTGVAITVCGIGLFTYHKYMSSIQSAMPLDAHGNPILDEEAMSLRHEGDEDDSVELDETVRLTSGRESDERQIDNPGHPEILFAEEEEGF
ncbi:triose-phosphate transporter family-domain-containing protein [Rhodocollybia butyracea]|uniref:Triose-phosphate transporter family-domain-containing protein n=1 Tax=Rhodocollybia butyracea TaxID=206335 RepID=A0A9P5PRG1_9AGAR|nr:triose-phosphate transporter family-domain-containing protein [Rhodocollybia butyracea]